MVSGRILIIDDEEILLRTFSILLSRRGYEVQCASSCAEAIRCVRGYIFDLWICDILMPGADGFETIKKLRQAVEDSQKESTGVIMMSGYMDQKFDYKILSTAPDVFIPKPFDTHFFLSQVDAMMERILRKRIDSSVYTEKIS